MLTFFTNPYPDELLYSAIARYHFYSGNINHKDTLEEVFGSQSVIPSVEIGSHFSVLSGKLGHNYSVENLIANHTIYPYYAIFLSEERQQEILQDIKSSGQGLYTRLGMIAGSICRKDGFYYCVECTKSDEKQFGEPYIHREHQLQGINYCPHHDCLLRKYPISRNQKSRVEFVRFEMKYISLLSPDDDEPYREIKIHIAKQAYKLLQLPIHKASRKEINLKYRVLLKELNLVTASNRVRQKDLYQAFLKKFPADFLVKNESSLDLENEYNWLKVITRNLKRHVHPFRHLLMLNFLNQDIESFISLEKDVGPFGKGPFPCLNRAASHYHQLVIPIVKITRDSKSNAPIGTFQCTCEFVYSRKGPDRYVEDRFRIGRVKIFGWVWQQRLNQLAKENFTYRAMARELGVSSKTIKSHLEKNVVYNKGKPSLATTLKKNYKSEILEVISEFPCLSRTAIRAKCEKQYMFLYRHHKEWLMKILPSKQKKQIITNKVDWTKRDQEYFSRIQSLHTKLLEQEKLVRITKSLLGKRLGILTNLERCLNKLPLTMRLLQDISETVQEFQIRRCYKVIDHLFLEGNSIPLWKVQRIAAVKSTYFQKIKGSLEEYLAQKQGSETIRLKI